MLVNKNKDAVSLLFEIMKDKLAAFSTSPANIIFDTSLRCGSAHLTVSDDIKSLHDITGLTIGIKTLDLESFDYRQISLLTKAVFHELQHVNQEYRHLYEDSAKMYSMGLTYITCLLYNDYYLDKYNYVHNLKEIEAEYYGLRNTYVFLKEIFNEDVASIYTLDIVNRRVNRYLKDSSKLYYIDVSKKYDSLDAIYDSFEKAMREAVTCTRHCDFWKDDAVLKAVCDEPNGLAQDEFLVRQYFTNNPVEAEYIRQNTIALKRLC